MTLVRRHLVGALVVVLAVAVGIALGGGPLQRDDVVPASSAPAETDDEDAGPDADDVAAASASTLYGARLEGRSVAVLAGPGVSGETLEALTGGIESADGSVSGTWRLTKALTEPSEKALVETLGDQLVEQLESKAAEPDAPGYERIGQLIGSGLATRRTDASAASQDALTIRQSLAAAGLVRGDDRDARLAPLVLVALGDDLDDYVVGGIVDGLAARSAGVVVAAPSRESDLTVVDELGAVTTVDGTDGELGRVAAVLALVGVEETPAGAYGASGADGLLPLG
ncbi:MAG: copper transporter [Nocardioides sp.]